MYSQMHSPECQDDLMQYSSRPPDATTGGTAHLRGHIVWKYENVKMTLCSTLLGHQMPLPGGQLIWGYTPSENMNSFWVWLLLHKGLLYKRPTSKMPNDSLPNLPIKIGNLVEIMTKSKAIKPRSLCCYYYVCKTTWSITITGQNASKPMFFAMKDSFWWVYS